MSGMGMNEYLERAREFAQYPEIGFGDTAQLNYLVMGLAGEVGEVCEKIKKVHRDNAGQFTVESRYAVAHEAGDAMWYLFMLIDKLGFSPSQVAAMNIMKLESRANRNQIHGDGDDR